MAKLPVDILDDTSPIVVLTWNKDRVQEVEAAKKKFDTYVRQGWIAFAVQPDRKHVHIFSFDASYEKVILTPIVEGG